MTASDKKIVIIDDDEAVRDSLSTLLEVSGYATQAFETAGAFLDDGGNEADIGCLLLDVRLPDADGIDLLEQLEKRDFAAPVIVITGHGDVPMAVKAMKIGAADFIEKPFDTDVLLQSIARALESWGQSEEVRALTQRAHAALEALTPRETDVMLKLIVGRPNKIIAYELGLSPRTVEVHRARIMKKTGADSLSHLVRMAISAGIDPEA